MKSLPRKTLGDLPDDESLLGVCFRYPGDGQLYYWFSQWSKGVFGKKNMGSGQVYPLMVKDLREALSWEVLDGYENGDALPAQPVVLNPKTEAAKWRQFGSQIET